MFAARATRSMPPRSSPDGCWLATDCPTPALSAENSEHPDKNIVIAIATPNIRPFREPARVMLVSYRLVGSKVLFAEGNITEERGTATCRDAPDLFFPGFVRRLMSLAWVC